MSSTPRTEAAWADAWYPNQPESPAEIMYALAQKLETEIIAASELAGRLQTENLLLRADRRTAMDRATAAESRLKTLRINQCLQVGDSPRADRAARVGTRNSVGMEEMR